MLTQLKDQPADKILALVQAFKDDPRKDKIDLGVGVYKDADGKTPIMRAVKKAEKQLWEQEQTKSYVALTGDPAYGAAMAQMVLGDAVPMDRVSKAATPGGTGAVRQGFELVQLANPQATVWVSDPTWPNHLTILKHLGIKTTLYRYFDSETCAVDFDSMLADLKGAKEGDVVLLHGCCHNPTGANLNKAQWKELVALMKAQGLIPMIDIAYQGFGDGLEDDAAATRLVASELPETIIAASCSKNFGIYRERTGILMTVSAEAATQKTAQGTLAYLNRQNYSFPPDHGARLVTMILNDPDLRKEWEDELEEVREGLLVLRKQLAEELQKATNSDRYGFIAEHRGMFSRLGVSPEMVEKLREDHAIYMVGDSRINIAGLNKDTVPILAKAIATVGG
ncbi:amino acid aminotransferase [Cognatishimia sp. MH4019]|uniref:amino acid aminotransferase n=1 Tax=Cognatishimia sp. MH4019 TaxID=2854030 RepID=UPI001CD2BEFF|nr:amino acid aminotransferase [Cognatishimia sp. MH4019]